MKKRIGRLHVLTDTALQSRFTHVELAHLAIRGGAETIQFRQKSGSTRELIRIATELQAVCFEAGATFVVNDRIDVALAAGADGVHLGQDDFPLALAREILGPDRILGASAGTVEEARRCAAAGADYVGFGPVYTTTSKADARPERGVELLGRAIREISVPVVAIGGLCVANVASVVRVGAHGVAVISAVCCTPDPAASARALRQAIVGEGDGHPV